MLYFQDELSPEIEMLINKAADEYGPKSEQYLLKAYAMADSDLTVLIGLYRFYYYQNRYQDALWVADKVMQVVGDKIEFPDDWKKITMAYVAEGVGHSFCMVRLYFFALKAAGYLNLRLSNFELGREMVEKVVAMDSADRMGAKLLLEVLDNNKADVLSFPQKQKLEAC